jgi:hypothetical protein
MRTAMFVLSLASLFVQGDGGSSRAASACAGDCLGTVSPAGAVVMICPQGDTPTFADVGVTLTIPFGGPVPEGSIYTIPCGNLVYCVLPQIDGPPDAAGTATFSGALAGGGYTDTWLWATGWIPEPPCIVAQLDVRLVSPDISGDLVVDLTDLSQFAMAWPPMPYDPRADLNGDAVVGLVDLSLVSQHFGHRCN